MQVAPGIYQLNVPIPDNPLGHVNCYVIEGTRGWVMVDTGWYTPEAFDFLQRGLRDIGLSLKDIATMIVTHVHPDHFGLAGRIKQLSPGTQLLMHRYESDLIDSRYIKFSELQERIAEILQRHGVPSEMLSTLKSASMPAIQYVTMTLAESLLYGGEIISTGIYNLEVIWTPGHSPGHICLYEPKNQLLFSGDHILPTTTPNVSYHMQSGDNPLGDYINALCKIQNLEVEKVLPGHEYIFGDLRGRISEIIHHHDARKTEIEEIAKRGASTAYEISSQMTWAAGRQTWAQLPPLHKRIAVMETIAHLESMRWEGKMKRVIRNDVALYGVR